MLSEEKLDNIIYKLKTQKGFDCKVSHLTLTKLCVQAREAIVQQPMRLKLKAPLHICGDLHGQSKELLRIIDKCGEPSETKYLFLGDYVDRGKQSLETISLLLAYMLRYPGNVNLIRGNHEDASVNKVYGFYDEMKRRYGTKLWRYFVDCFEVLPVAATVDDRIFCCHGGLSPHLEKLQQIDDLPRPTEVPNEGLMCDLLWADPNPKTLGWGYNEDRGCSFTYDANIVYEFLQRNDFDLICRGHEVIDEGYEFFANRKLITIFSAPNYCGEINNSGAVLKVDKDLKCSLIIFKPTMICRTS